jgi:hypothetical protein
MVVNDDFPIVGAIGNHDELQWSGYQSMFARRFAASGLNQTCYGVVGVHTVCNYKGLTIVSSGIGTAQSNQSAGVEFASSAFQALGSSFHGWRICSWHKNQRLFQIGGKSDEVGYEIYDLCRQNAAVISTGHEHSYCRTKTMTSFATQTFVEPVNNTVTVSAGTTVSWVSGVSGQQVRTQDATLAANPWWASALSASSAPALKSGALICKFNYNGQVDLAYCYFKQVDGVVREEFFIKNSFYGPAPAPTPTSAPTPSTTSAPTPSTTAPSTTEITTSPTPSTTGLKRKKRDNDG